jgi:hypothetical protein
LDLPTNSQCASPRHTTASSCSTDQIWRAAMSKHFAGATQAGEPEAKACRLNCASSLSAPIISTLKVCPCPLFDGTMAQL